MKFKKHIGVVAALALAVAAPLSGMTQAAADEAQNPYSGSTAAYSSAFITKELQTINGQKFSEQFTFTFTPENNAPALDPVNITISTESDEYVASSDNTTLTYYGVSDTDIVQSILAKQKSGSFTNNGIYKYKVSETATGTQYVDYDKTAYTLVVLVSGDTVNVQVVKRNDPDKDAGAKVDPSMDKVITTTTSAGKQNTEFKKSDFVFTNKYKLDFTDSDLNQGTLTFTKNATGLNADPEAEYEFTITFVTPVSNALSKITAAAPTTVKDKPIESAQAPTNQDGAFKFKLKANQKIKFSNIQEGTLYTIVEQGGAWTAKVNAGDIRVDDDSALPQATSQSSAQGKAFTVDFNTSHRTIILGQAGTAVITNEWSNTNPTGLVINNLPFVLMIGIPVLVAAGYVVLRRKGVQI